LTVYNYHNHAFLHGFQLVPLVVSYSNTRVVKLFVSTNGTVTHNHATTLTSTFANTVHLISTGGGTNV